MKTFPAKPLLVFTAVVAAIRLYLFLDSPIRFLSPSILAAVLFLYSPVPYYRDRGFPSWTSVADPGKSALAVLLLAGAGAAFFYVFLLLPLPPAISPYRGTVPISLPLAAHFLFLAALPEEVFFRGYLYDAFDEAGWEPILPTALLFAVSHVAIAPSPIRALTFFPGLLLGWGRKTSGNVYVPLSIHFLYNLFPSLIGGPA
jgi:membrane protease YdiL (CAAX protease family)